MLLNILQHTGLPLIPPTHSMQFSRPKCPSTEVARPRAQGGDGGKLRPSGECPPPTEAAAPGAHSEIDLIRSCLKILGLLFSSHCTHAFHLLLCILAFLCFKNVRFSLLPHQKRKKEMLKERKQETAAKKATLEKHLILA